MNLIEISVLLLSIFTYQSSNNIRDLIPGILMSIKIFGFFAYHYFELYSIIYLLFKNTINDITDNTSSKILYNLKYDNLKRYRRQLGYKVDWFWEYVFCNTDSGELEYGWFEGLYLNEKIYNYKRLKNIHKIIKNKKLIMDDYKNTYNFQEYENMEIEIILQNHYVILHDDKKENDIYYYKLSNNKYINIINYRGIYYVGIGSYSIKRETFIELMKEKGNSMYKKNKFYNWFGYHLIHNLSKSEIISIFYDEDQIIDVTININKIRINCSFELHPDQELLSDWYSEIRVYGCCT